MKELLPRERFIRALRHEPVDRVPLLYRMKHEAKDKLARIYGIQDAATGRKHNPELELRLGNDAIIYQIGINADFSHRPIPIGETWTNHFGVGYGKSGLEGRTPEEQEEFAKTQEYWRDVSGRGPRFRSPDSPLAGDQRWPNGGLVVRLQELRRRMRQGV